MSIQKHLARFSVALMILLAVAGQAHERRINTWLVIGPFPSPNFEGFRTDFINGENKVSPSLGGISGGKQWIALDDRLYCRNQDDYVDLSTFFMPRRPGAPTGGNEHVAAYVHTYVWSPIDQDNQLQIGASDGLKAWLNGNLVMSLEPVERQPIRDQYQALVRLKAGWNSLLIKSVNAFRIWGFYARLADAQGRPLDGLEYCIDTPEGALTVSTTELPKGYTGWPYVELTVRGVKPLHSVPSASPFRLMAGGGKPPYTWSLVDGKLPPGLLLDTGEGELHGTCEESPGKFRFTVQVNDAAGATVKAALMLEVVVRPTRWYEDAKIGGLIHGSMEAEKGYNLPYGYPDWQAKSMAKQGYCWAAQTTGYEPGSKDWPGWYHPQYKSATDFSFRKNDEYKAAFVTGNVGFGSYLGLPDATAHLYPPANGNEIRNYPHWPRYLDYMQRYFEEWFAYAKPALIYLDGAGFAAPDQRVDVYDPRNLGYDLDAIYSMAKTVSPETLIVANSGGDPGLDWRLGDCDVFSTEGMNDGYNPIWDRWPIGHSGFYPKNIPNESWRYPFTHPKWGNYLDKSEEWTRSIITMIGEGYLVNLDHSVGEGREKLHESIGSWLHPRLASIQGTRPGPVFGASWGYSMQKENKIYLHVLHNPRGKIGLPSGMTELLVRPLGSSVKSVRTFPDGKLLKFAQENSELIIDLAATRLDPVDAIFVVEIGN